jgi:signal transduction histidine kinase
MQSSIQRLSLPTYLLRLLAVLGLYFAAGKIGLSIPFTSGNVSPFWPASGIALAAVLLWGYKIWPAIAGAAFLVNFLSPIPVQAAVGLALGNTSGALFGGFLLRRFGFSSALARLRDVIALLILGALVSTVVAATVGTTTLFLTHVKAWSGFETAVPVWWFGDGMGVLIATPLFLTARHVRTMLRGSHRAEIISLFTGTAATSFLVFSQTFVQSARDDVLAFAVFPFVIWAAIRFRLEGVSLVCLLTAMIAVWGTAHGYGPFVKHGPIHDAILLQLFLAVLSVSGLTLAAVINERTHAEYALRNLSGRLLRIQDDERRRLARDLHDSTGQNLVALQMNLAALSQRVPQADHRSSDLFNGSIEILERIVKEIRTLSYLLHPPLLDEAGLASALQWYVDGIAKRSQMNIELSVSSHLGRLSEELETAIFRIVQECLTNIHRHSGSCIARIRIIQDKDQVVVTIRDEGKGVRSELLGEPIANPSSFGVGIRGIAERVRELGGQLRLQRALPGTIVEVILPVQRRDTAAGATKDAKAQQKGA